MLDNLLEYFLTQPRRLVAMGALLVRLGGFLMVVGIIGRAATASISVVQGMTTRTRPAVALADVLPDAFSWWMPESVVGFGLALLLVVGGLAVVHTGRAYERMWRY